VAANIAEGFKKKGLADKARFLNISQGSLSETEYYISLAQDLKYSQMNGLQQIAEEISKLLVAYSKSILK
jgi:four helix bundle protein